MNLRFYLLSCSIRKVELVFFELSLKDSIQRSQFLLLYLCPFHLCYYYYLNMLQQREIGKYYLTTPLGQGHFGYVNKCFNKQTNQVYAIKQVKLQDAQNLQILKFKHPNIVQVHDIFQFSEYQYIVMTCYQHTLTSFRNASPKDNFQQIFIQILEGLLYLHKLNYAHCDLKLNNIFYKYSHNKIKVVIGDFSNIKAKNQTRINSDKYLFVLLCIQWIFKLDIRHDNRYPPFDIFQKNFNFEEFQQGKHNQFTRFIMTFIRKPIDKWPSFLTMYNKMKSLKKVNKGLAKIHKRYKTKRKYQKKIDL